MDDILAQPSTENNKSSMMKILAPLFIVIFMVILGLVKKQNPDFPLFYVILIGAVILIFGAIAFFGVDIAHRFDKIKTLNKNKNVLPAPAETKVLWDKAMVALTNPIYRDHIKDYIQTINHSVGKNMKSLVVEFQVHSVYRPRLRCSILLNANYPDRMPTVLFEPNAYVLRQAIQNISFDPEDPANEEETVIHNELTGTTATTKKKTYNKKDINPAAVKKEALV